MRKRYPLALLVILALSVSCRTTTDCNSLFSLLNTDFISGNFREVSRLADSIRASCTGSGELLRKADSLVEISERIRLDFSLTEADFMSRVDKYLGRRTDSMFSAWDEKKWIEWRMIDGQRMYFNRSASNLSLLRMFYEEKEKQDRETAIDPEMTDRLAHTKEIVSKTSGTPEPVVPVSMNITYTITIQPDAVPDGGKIRCWLPYPREDHSRQTSAELLSATQENYILSPGSVTHRSVYMEKESVKGLPTTFSISYRYTSSGIWFDLHSVTIKPYDRESSLCKKYTSEQLPNICFTDSICHLADAITSPGDSPEVIVKKIYMWFKENIPWTGALEYSLIPNIPQYVFENRRGDCGMQTFLFMSMLRYKGIPVRWQSGWKVPPGFKNLHDWCEVYYEGPGWVPVDVSYDLQASDDKKLKEFYVSGIDSYRLIINDGVAGPLYPEKKFMRSEPYDFQRGEVEWEGGNLYFDKWDYSMQIEYLK